MNDIRLSDYLSILLRRRKLFLAVAGAVFLLTLVFTYNWKNYRAEATVEVAQPEVASDVTQSADTARGAMEAMADLSISRVRQKVLSTGSLIEIITKFNLYEKSRKYTPIEAVADKMRDKIQVRLVASSLANPASAQKAAVRELSAIAFVLSFDYPSPLIAQQVTNELVSRFLDEDLKDRRNKAKETSRFLESQLQVLEASLVEQEKKIAEFRLANADLRPDALAFNQQASISTNLTLQNIDSQITSNLGSQGALRAQLALTDPYSRVLEEGRVMTTPAMQLKMLKSEFATLTAKYGPEHPDVLKVARQVAGLEAQANGRADTGRIEAKIIDAKAKLATAQSAYGNDNPDVQSLQTQVTSLEEQLERARKAGSFTSRSKVDADNPAYLQILAQIQSQEEQYKALMEQKNNLLQQQDKYQRAVNQNPVAEQQLAALTRDYDNAQQRYRELKAKKLTADMTETIEQDGSGQHLVVINPPELPLTTYPARLLFVAVGFVLAFLGGLASVVAAQLLVQTIAGSQHLESLIGVAPLATIPHIKTRDEETRMDRHKLKILGGIVAVALIGLIVFSYVVMPLDVLFAVVMHRIGLN